MQTTRLLACLLLIAVSRLGCGHQTSAPPSSAIPSAAAPAPSAAPWTSVATSAADVAAWLAGAKQIDLTHPFNEDTIYWPTEEGFRLIRGTAGITEKGYYYAANRFTAAEHGGTHLDAPMHFSAGGQTVDQLPIQRFMGAGR